MKLSLRLISRIQCVAGSVHLLIPTTRCGTRGSPPDVLFADSRQCVTAIFKFNSQLNTWAIAMASSVSSSIHPFTRPPFRQSLHLSVCLVISLHVCLPVCLFVCLPVCLSICLSLCLYVYPRLPSVNHSLNPSICSYFCLFIMLLVNSSFHPFLRSLVHLQYPSIPFRMFIHLCYISVCSSVCLSFRSSFPLSSLQPFLH